MNAISVRGVAKQFQVRNPHRPHTLHEALSQGFHRFRPEDTFWALRGIDLDVPRGTTLGMIGPNGAGKSTLLRLIAGVGRPDRGTIETSGAVTALLDLGAGFHPDLTGRENVHLYGVITGWTRAEVRRRFEEIVGFAELESFIDNPLRTYSTGMRMRLAFSVAALADPEIFLLDEVLVVGDLAFQKKCTARIDQLRANGCTLVLCSHDTALVRGFCDLAIRLEAGRLVARGPVEEVLDAYSRLVAEND